MVSRSSRADLALEESCRGGGGLLACMLLPDAPLPMISFLVR